MRSEMGIGSLKISLMITMYNCKAALELVLLSAIRQSRLPKGSFYNLLRRESLPRPVRWSREEHFQEGSVLMDTVKRFKGLERDIIFLWLDQASTSEDALMYVGISRAKSVLYFVGDSEIMRSLDLP